MDNYEKMVTNIKELIKILEESELEQYVDNEKIHSDPDYLLYISLKKWEYTNC
jgi:hypothetical protein